MTSRKRKRANEGGLDGQRAIRILALLVLAAIFAVGGLGLGAPRQNANGTGAPTTGPGSPTAVIFPTVPPGGLQLVADRMYFAPGGLFSIPHLLGWELAQGGEERVDPSQGVKITRVGATFINGDVLSVVHAFVEKDPDRSAKTLADLDKYYDKTNLDSAWINFTGGWKDTGRSTQGDKFIINFELGLNGNTYLGRQVSHFENDWLEVTRLVAPQNNPQLLDQLEGAIWPYFSLYPSSVNSPLAWSASADSAFGYVIKYPSDWKRIDGSPGKPYVVIGTLRDVSVTLTTNAEPGKPAKTEADARAWLAAWRPKSTVLSANPITRGDLSGFTLSYNDPDPDGNARSSLLTLLNGTNGTLYSINFLTSLRSVDLLKPGSTVPPELAQIQDSFSVLPMARFVPTLTPSVTPTPSITPTTTITSTPSATLATTTPVPTTAAPPSPTLTGTPGGTF